MSMSIMLSKQQTSTDIANGRLDMKAITIRPSIGDARKLALA
jgi:hypothetical protein